MHDPPSRIERLLEAVLIEEHGLEPRPTSAGHMAGDLLNVARLASLG